MTALSVIAPTLATGGTPLNAAQRRSTPGGHSPPEPDPQRLVPLRETREPQAKVWFCHPSGRVHERGSPGCPRGGRARSLPPAALLVAGLGHATLRRSVARTGWPRPESGEGSCLAHICVIRSPRLALPLRLSGGVGASRPGPVRLRAANRAFLKRYVKGESYALSPSFYV